MNTLPDTYTPEDHAKLLNEVIALTSELTRCIPTDEVKVVHAYVLAMLIAIKIDPTETDIEFYFAGLNMDAKLSELGKAKDIVINFTNYSILIVNNPEQNTSAFSIVPLDQCYNAVNIKIDQSKRALYDEGYPILM